MVTWIDNVLNSGTLVWIVLGLIAFSIYLRKTGQTLPEFIRGLRESFNAMKEEVE